MKSFVRSNDVNSRVDFSTLNKRDWLSSLSTVSAVDPLEKEIIPVKNLKPVLSIVTEHECVSTQVWTKYNVVLSAFWERTDPAMD